MLTELIHNLQILVYLIFILALASAGVEFRSR